MQRQSDERKLRYSFFHVTVNTHKQMGWEWQEPLREAIEGLNNRQTTADLWGKPADRIERSLVRMEEVGFELSGRASLLHAHFIWEVLHSSVLSMGKDHIQRHLQDYIDAETGLLGSYVHVQCLTERSKAANYNRKQQYQEEAEGKLLPETLIRF